MILDTRHDQLNAYERTAPAADRAHIERAVAVARDFLTVADTVRQSRFNAEREAEEIATAQSTAIDGWKAAVDGADLTIGIEQQQGVDGWDADAHTRATERRRLADVIDLDALRRSDDPDRIQRDVDTAYRLGGQAVGEEARTEAMTVLRALQTKAEYRGNQLGSKAALVLVKMMGAKQAAGRDAVREGFEQRKARVRETICAIANVVALGPALRAALRRTTAPVPASAEDRRFVVGSYWERNPSMIRRGR